jgi:hypothetical protein
MLQMVHEEEPLLLGDQNTNASDDSNTKNNKAEPPSLVGLRQRPGALEAQVIARIVVLFAVLVIAIVLLLFREREPHHNHA